MNGVKDDSGDALQDILYPVDLPDFEEGPEGGETLYEPFLQPNIGFENLHRIAMEGVV